MAVAAGDVSSPELLRLLGHPLRWQILAELARSDRHVGELVALVGEPQNGVSYHLARLLSAGLVSVRRSSADGRGAYYIVDLTRCGELLAGAGGALHPGLRLGFPSYARPVRKGRRPARVLFLCTGNSLRSPMAEALLARRGEDNVRVASAGSHPKPVHPLAIRVLAEHGIDLAEHRPRHVDELARRRFDLVITLCDRMREVCPELSGAPDLVHWSIPDPAVTNVSAAQARSAVRVLGAELERRIGFLLHDLAAARSS